MTMRLFFIGGPHHHKSGWYNGPEEGAPEILYLTEGTVGSEARVVADPNHPFATGKLVRYHHTGLDGTGQEVYTYLPENP